MYVYIYIYVYHQPGMRTFFLSKWTHQLRGTFLIIKVRRSWTDLEFTSRRIPGCQQAINSWQHWELYNPLVAEFPWNQTGFGSCFVRWRCFFPVWWDTQQNAVYFSESVATRVGSYPPFYPFPSKILKNWISWDCVVTLIYINRILWWFTGIDPLKQQESWAQTLLGSQTLFGSSRSESKSTGSREDHAWNRTGSSFTFWTS